MLSLKSLACAHHARAIIARVSNVIRVFFGFEFLGAKSFVCLLVCFENVTLSSNRSFTITA